MQPYSEPVYTKKYLDFKASLIYVLLPLLSNKVSLQSIKTQFGKVDKGLILACNNVL